MKNRCVIIGGGDCHKSLIYDYDKHSDFLIAADGGLKHCIDFNIEPDLIIGDFDSYFGDLPNNIDTIKLPTAKDDTDLMYAARIGVNKRFSSFLLLGCYGSRPDHNFAMYQTMHWIKSELNNSFCVSRGLGFEAYVICNESKDFTFFNERYVSVFALGGIANGVSISGAEYSLKNAELTPLFPVGVSNTCSSKCNISVNNGSLLILTVDKTL